VVVNVAGNAVVHALYDVPDYFCREFPVVCCVSRLLGLGSDLFMIVAVISLIDLRGEVVQH